MTALLERITSVADRLGLPIAVGLYTATPLPDTYLVAIPMADVFDVFADNTPAVEVEEVRLSLFTTGNYLAERDRLTAAMLEAGLTVTARRYLTLYAVLPSFLVWVLMCALMLQHGSSVSRAVPRRFAFEGNMPSDLGFYGAGDGSRTRL